MNTCIVSKSLWKEDLKALNNAFGQMLPFTLHHTARLSASLRENTANAIKRFTVAMSGSNIQREKRQKDRERKTNKTDEMRDICSQMNHQYGPDNRRTSSEANTVTMR